MHVTGNCLTSPTVNKSLINLKDDTAAANFSAIEDDTGVLQSIPVLKTTSLREAEALMESTIIPLWQSHQLIGVIYKLLREAQAFGESRLRKVQCL
ncbi:hypothetical protein TNIN_407991 [Trichonephila inaurata madagascariensis]|uniref:Uncharacterized protein n=1 Tax=Trichonephila inaurata madagascariensis TaxID=2747483 RepID=A0A8X7BZP7_9ARAC|nr:hypothetical protein TNIN_407991 [Trichonephila inaurata madagascariensis]